MKNTIPSVGGAIVSDHLKKTFSVISAEICVVKSAHSFLFEFHFVQRSFPVSLDYLAKKKKYVGAILEKIVILLKENWSHITKF